MKTYFVSPVFHLHVLGFRCLHLCEISHLNSAVVNPHLMCQTGKHTNKSHPQGNRLPFQIISSCSYYLKLTNYPKLPVFVTSHRRPIGRHKRIGPVPPGVPVLRNQNPVD